MGSAVFLLAYALLILAQAALVYYRLDGPTREVLLAAARAVLTAFLVWNLVRLRAWAWWVSTIVSGALVLLGVLGFLIVFVTTLLGPEGAEPDIALLEMPLKVLLAMTFLCLVASFGTLLTGLVLKVTVSREAIVRTPTRMLGTVVLVVLLAAGALALKAVRDPNPWIAPFDATGPTVSGATAAPTVTTIKAKPSGVALADGFGSLAVDASRSRILVSSPQSNVVSVLDQDGRVVRRIKIDGGPNAMLVDGDRLYVVATSAGRVDVLDASTYRRIAQFGAGSLVEPGPLVMAGGRLWTSTGPCQRHTTSLVSIDPRNGALVVHPPIDDLRYCIDLATSETEPDVLLGFQPGLSPAIVSRLDVSGPSPVVVANHLTSLGNLRQLDVMPGGDRFVAASGAPYEILEYRTADLGESGLVYPAAAYPTAVATTPARGGMVAAGIDSVDGPDVLVFRRGDPQPASTLELGAGRTLLSRSLAWSPDGSTLFAVSTDSQVDDVRFHVLRP